MTKYPFIPAPELPQLSDAEAMRCAQNFYEQIKSRRTIRDFANTAVPRAVIEQCLLAAGTAPNGANLQPWHFAVVSDPDIKKQIRVGAEKEEQEFYSGRAPQDWLEDLAALGTDEHKPFLETAPWLIVIFARAYRIDSEGKKRKNYYVSESVGIATGFLINALHHCGLATLTHTPSPMKFLNTILGRPENERPYLILVVGKPAPDAQVPDIRKLPLNDIASFH
ncbi:MAG: nitroreductase family protein [Pirellulaceae bacterium]